MTIQKLKPTIEKRTEPYEFYEALDLLSQNTDIAFTCDEFNDGEYIAFDYDDFTLSFYSGATLISRDQSEVYIEEDKSRISKSEFPVTLECFKRQWYAVNFDRVYTLEIIHYYDFRDSDAANAYDKRFSELSREEKREFLTELLEDALDEEPDFYIDGKTAMDV